MIGLVFLEMYIIKEKYELNNFQIEGRIAKFYENLPFLYINTCTKLKKNLI